MRFEERLSRMPLYFQKACELADALMATKNGSIRVKPYPPQSNIFHLYLQLGESASFDVARARVAKEEKVWIKSLRKKSVDIPGWSYIEIYVGENAIGLDTAIAVKCIELLIRYTQE